MIMKKMYISPRMETIVIMSNVIATSAGAPTEIGDVNGNLDPGAPGQDGASGGWAPTRGGRWE